MLRLATCAALCLVSGASAKTTLLRSRAPETVPAVDSIGNARTEFNVAKQNAMQFAQAGMGAAEAVAPKVYQVSPGIKGGLAFEPSAGQNDPAVHIRPRADYAEPVKQIGEFLGNHGYKEDVKDLLVEIDKSQNYMKGLKLRIAEKENFVDSLIAREDMLQEDVNKDKQAMDNLQAHVKALHARVEKIKKTKQLDELKAQFDEYNSAATKLSSQADQLASVKAALQIKMSNLSGERDALGAQEKNEMSVSIGVGESSAAAGASGAAGVPAAGGEAAAAGGEAAAAGGEAAAGASGSAFM